MKQIIICLLFLLANTASFCQEMKSSHPLTREEYLSKSHNQRKAAKVLLIGGGALIGLSAILASSDKETSFDEAGTYAILAGAGIVASLTSIPLFIAANRNRKKAKHATAGLKMEPSSYSYAYPALTFKISL